MADGQESVSGVEARDVRRERYEAVLRAVDYQTGGHDTASPQPPAVPESSIIQILARTYGGEAVGSSIRAAAANGDLVRFRDVDGVVRLARADADGLRRVAVWAAERPGGPVRELVAFANRRASRAGQSDARGSRFADKKCKTELWPQFARPQTRRRRDVRVTPTPHGPRTPLQNTMPINRVSRYEYAGWSG